MGKLKAIRALTHFSQEATMARCTNCYLEIQPGNHICPRCHQPVDENSLTTWPIVLFALACILLIGGIAFIFLRH